VKGFLSSRKSPSLEKEKKKRRGIGKVLRGTLHMEAGTRKIERREGGGNPLEQITKGGCAGRLYFPSTGRRKPSWAPQKILNQLGGPEAEGVHGSSSLHTIRREIPFLGPPEGREFIKRYKKGRHLLPYRGELPSLNDKKLQGGKEKVFKVQKKLLHRTPKRATSDSQKSRRKEEASHIQGGERKPPRRKTICPEEGTRKEITSLSIGETLSSRKRIFRQRRKIFDEDHPSWKTFS